MYEGVNGLKPNFYFDIINKKKKENINYGEPIKIKHFK